MHAFYAELTNHKNPLRPRRCTRCILRQRTTPGVSAVAFAAVERQTSSCSSSSRNQGGGDEHDSHVVLHCADGSGTMFEASTSGAVWNVERDSSSGPADDVPAESATAAGRGWYVCADLEASLLVREKLCGEACVCVAALPCELDMTTGLSSGLVFIA